MRVSCTIEVRKLESGDTEVLLERNAGFGRDSKLHRELFILTDSPETQTLVRHIERLAVNG